jgi:hypothetical protein
MTKKEPVTVCRANPIDRVTGTSRRTLYRNEALDRKEYIPRESHPSRAA